MKKNQWNSAQSLVEIALIFPVVFFLITGFLDMGRAVFYYSSLSNAVREATRAAIVDNDYLVEADNYPENNALVDIVYEKSFGLLVDDFVSISAVPDPAGGPYTRILVSAEYKFNPVTPGIKLILGAQDGIVLRAHSTMWVSPGAQ